MQFSTQITLEGIRRYHRKPDLTASDLVGDTTLVTKYLDANHIAYQTIDGKPDVNVHLFSMGIPV